MNDKWDKGFNLLDEAFELIGEGIDDFFKHPPVGAKITSKTTTEDMSDIIHIRISSWGDRRKAAWRLLTRGQFTIRKKKSDKGN